MWFCERHFITSVNKTSFKCKLWQKKLTWTLLLSILLWNNALYCGFIWPFWTVKECTRKAFTSKTKVQQLVVILLKYGITFLLYNNGNISKCLQMHVWSSFFVTHFHKSNFQRMLILVYKYEWQYFCMLFD